MLKSIVYGYQLKKFLALHHHLVGPLNVTMNIKMEGLATATTLGLELGIE